ncbi:YggT family protein [Balnearium lithotrophicum]|uniref:YggT family protein n=1 Tax=Balnearium lithotrophicum TaxID=223788 RepID=A0A521DS76_9BACT|nr:YggT family protein [Balnearium lithotrophicum]SMO73720.1 YggT family protein [Balnearium lithotrophicum]
MVELIKSSVHLAIEILTWFIVVGALLTFIPPHNRNSTICRIIHALDLVLSPIRKLVPPIGGIDLSPLVAIILLQLIDQLIRGI